MHSRVTWLLVLVSLGIACTSSAPQPVPGDAKQQTQVPSGEAENATAGEGSATEADGEPSKAPADPDPTEATEQPADPTPAPETEAESAVESGAGEPETGTDGWPAPRTLTQTPVAPAAESRSPTWIKAYEQAGKKLSFEPGLSRGVVLRIDGAPHVLAEDGAWALNEAIDARSPKALEHAPTIEGFWPKNAWRVSKKELDAKQLAREDLPEEWMEWGGPPIRFRFHTFRGNNRWVAQKTNMVGEHDDYTLEEPGGVTDPDSDEYVIWAPSPRRGLVVTKAEVPREDEPEVLIHFERVGGGDAPESMPIRDGQVRALFETKGGQMFLFMGGFGSLVAQRSCSLDKDELECAAESRVRVAAAATDGYVKLTHSAHRHRKSASFALTAKAPSDAGPSGYLLHYETGGFKLEALPAGKVVTQLISADDGSLWVALGEELWHRSNGGSWAKVTTPPELAGKGDLRIALDKAETPHVWVSAVNGSAVFTAPAVFEATG